jgi:hypothetical protein
MKNYRFIRNGNHVIIGGDILPSNMLKVDQDWLAGKSLAHIISVEGEVIKYQDCSSGNIFERDSFGFQSRYCLIIQPHEMNYYSQGLQMNSDIEEF